MTLLTGPVYKCRVEEFVNLLIARLACKTMERLGENRPIGRSFDPERDSKLPKTKTKEYSIDVASRAKRKPVLLQTRVPYECKTSFISALLRTSSPRVDCKHRRKCTLPKIFPKTGQNHFFTREIWPPLSHPSIFFLLF